MVIDQTLFIYIALFVGVMMFAEGAFLLLQESLSGPRRAMNRRLRMIENSSNREVLAKLRRENPDRISAAFAKVVPFLNVLIVNSGMTVSLVRIVVIMLSIGVILFALLRLGSVASPAMALLIALPVGVLLPVLFLMRMRAKRTLKFSTQLPDALDLIVRSLRAGHPISSAMGLVAQQMPDPSGTEFGIAVDEMTYGLGMHEALKNMAYRVPHPDLLFVIVSVQIQYTVGGNLAEILSNLAKVIRDRFYMFAKIKAITAEARLSAIVIGVLPFAVAGLVNLLNPQYYFAVKDDPLFIPVMGLAFGLFVVGEFILWRMANPHV